MFVGERRGFLFAALSQRPSQGRSDLGSHLMLFDTERRKKPNQTPPLFPPQPNPPPFPPQPNPPCPPPLIFGSFQPLPFLSPIIRGQVFASPLPSALCSAPSCLLPPPPQNGTCWDFPLGGSRNGAQKLGMFGGRLHFLPISSPMSAFLPPPSPPPSPPHHPGCSVPSSPPPPLPAAGQ